MNILLVRHVNHAYVFSRSLSHVTGRTGNALTEFLLDTTINTPLLLRLKFTDWIKESAPSAIVFPVSWETWRKDPVGLAKLFKLLTYIAARDSATLAILVPEITEQAQEDWIRAQEESMASFQNVLMLFDASFEDPILAGVVPSCMAKMLIQSVNGGIFGRYSCLLSNRGVKLRPVFQRHPLYVNPDRRTGR